MTKPHLLAAMSSSRSDDVTKCVCLCVLLFFSLKHSELFMQDVSRVLQRCLIGVSRMSQGRFMGVPRVFKRCLEDVSREFQEILKGVLMES